MFSGQQPGCSRCEEPRREAATLPGVPAGSTFKSQNNQFQEPAAILPPMPPPQVTTTLHPHFTGLTPLPSMCSGSFSPNKLSETQLVCLPPLRRDYLRQKEDGRCLATAGHPRNATSVSTRPWTTRSLRLISEGTLLAPEGLLSQERESHEWGSEFEGHRPYPAPQDNGSFA